jgi:translation elongation factor EF-G
VTDSCPLPLRVRLTDPSEPFQLRFAERAATLVVIPGVRWEVAASGLTLSGVVERDLERAALAVRNAFPLATVGSIEVVYLNGPEWLEPYVLVRVTTPEDFFGDVVLDLSRRRGVIEMMDDVPDGKRVTATVPLAELLGYDAALRALSRERASFECQLVDYRPLREPSPPRPRPAARA